MHNGFNQSINDLFVMALFGLFSSFGFFFWGWKAFRKKRVIENIPTSKIRSIAMGLVEVSGKADTSHELQTPYSCTKCVYYKYLKERYQRSGKNSRWVTVDKGESISSFTLDDSTGKVLVEPVGLEYIGDKRYFHNDGNLRFSEWFILNHEKIYLIGTAQKSQEAQSIKRFKLSEKLSELRNNKEKMMSYDSNKDGSIDSMEWEIACKEIENELARCENTKEFSDLSDVAISKGAGNEFFIASEKSEKELIKSLNFHIIAGIWGGSLLFLACLAYLIHSLV